MTRPNLWQTTELHAIAFESTYAQYVAMCKHNDPDRYVVNSRTYDLLKIIYKDELENDIKHS